MFSNSAMFVEWLKAAGIRALRTMAQTAIATIGSSVLFDEVDWAVVGSAALMGGIASLLMSIAGLPEVKSLEAKNDD